MERTTSTPWLSSVPLDRPMGCLVEVTPHGSRTLLTIMFGLQVVLRFPRSRLPLSPLVPPSRSREWSLPGSSGSTSTSIFCATPFSRPTVVRAGDTPSSCSKTLPTFSRHWSLLLLLVFLRLLQPHPFPFHFRLLTTLRLRFRTTTRPPILLSVLFYKLLDLVLRWFRRLRAALSTRSAPRLRP